MIDARRPGSRRARIGRGSIGHVNLRGSMCSPDRSRHFQPRGLAVTQGQQAAVRDRLLLLHQARRRAGATTRARQGVVCRVNISTSSKRRSAATGPRRAIALAPAGHRLHGRLDRRRRARPDLRVPEPDAEHRHPRQPGLPAEHRRLAGRPAALQRRHAGVRERASTALAAARQVDAQRRQVPQPAPRRARRRSRARRSSSSPTPWAIGFTNQSGAGTAYVVSAGSDLLVKVNVGARRQAEQHRSTRDTTRYIDLNDPANPATSGDNAGKNPQGIVDQQGAARGPTS